MELSKPAMGSPPHPDLNALAAFIDRRLSEDERHAVVSHLADCGECRATVATFARGSAVRMPRAYLPTWMSVAAGLVLATTVGLVMWRGNTTPIGDAAPAADIALPGPAEPPAAPPAGRSQVGVDSDPTPTRSPDLTTRRGGERRIDGKAFQLVAGEWVDSSYDPLAALPEREVAGEEARSALLARLPGLAKFAALGPKVTIVYDKTVYRFVP